MTTAETLILLQRLKSAYPNTIIEAGAAAEYQRHLDRYPATIVAHAVDDHIRTSRYFPAISELVDACRTIRRRSQPELPLEPPKDAVPPGEAKRLIAETVAQLGGLEDAESDESRIVRRRERLADADWVAAGRRCYEEWRGVLGAELATQRVRKHYPLHADQILDAPTDTGSVAR